MIPLSATYAVQVQGTVNGVPFGPRPGTLLVASTVTVATTNGINPVELCLRSGSPFITPEPGAIWLSTNAACINPNGARQDMAFVGADAGAGAVTVRPDSRISATGVNGFSQSSGLTAGVWQIFEGAANLTFSANAQTVAGNLDLLGTGAIFHSENRYVATLAGQASQITLPPGVVQPPVIDRPDTRRPTIRLLAGDRRVTSRRVVRIATLTCPAGPCTVRKPRRARITIAGKRFRAVVLAPRRLASGKRGTMRLRLSRPAFRRLAGHRPRVKVKITVTAAGQTVKRTIIRRLKRSR